VNLTLKSYRAGIIPSLLAEKMIGIADEKGFSDYMVPGSNMASACWGMSGAST